MKEEISFTFKLCDTSHIEELFIMQNNINNIISQRDSIQNAFTCIDKEGFQKFMQKPNAIIGAFVRNELVAFAIFQVQHIDEVNIPIVKNNMSENNISQIANVVSTMVKPPYRGQRLQKRLLIILEGIAAHFEISSLYTIIPTQNTHAIKNIEALDYTHCGCDDASNHLYIKNLKTNVNRKEGIS